MELGELTSTQHESCQVGGVSLSIMSQNIFVSHVNSINTNSKGESETSIFRQYISRTVNKPFTLSTPRLNHARDGGNSLVSNNWTTGVARMT